MRNVRFVITLCLFILLGTHLVKAQTVTNPNDREYSLQTPQGIIKGMMMTPGIGEGYPVVLLIAGSGPTDMNGNSMQLGIQPNTLKLIAEGLAQKGIATVRFDKRGIASSAAAAKDEFSLRFDDYVNDVRLWIDKLAGDRRFKGVYVLGHSEGALIGMVACRSNTKVKGFISVAGSGKSMDKLIESQLSALPQELKDRVVAINDSLRNGKLYPQVPLGLQALFRTSVQPYLISCYKYNPIDIIGTLEMPVMIVQGKTDIQVPWADAELLKQAAPKAGLFLIADMNHVLKDCSVMEQQAQLATYSDPSLPLNSELLLLLEKFVKNP